MNLKKNIRGNNYERNKYRGNIFKRIKWIK